MNSSISALLVTAPPDYRSSRAKTVAYYVLVIAGGQVLVPLLLCLFLFNKGFKRHPTLLLYLLSWVAYSVASCLLLYAGHVNDVVPPYDLCLAQVSLINAAYWMIAFGAVALMLHLRFTLPTVNPNATAYAPIRDGLLVALSPVMAGVYLVLFFVAHRVKPSLVAVERGRVTCRFQSTPDARFFSKLTPVLLALLLTICFGMSIYMLRKTVHKLLDIRGWKLKRSLQAPRGPWLRILTRFIVFGFYSITTMIASFIEAVTPQGPAHEFVDYYVATLPLAAFLIFGTLPDIRKIWIEWRTNRSMRTSEFDMHIVSGNRMTRHGWSRSDATASTLVSPTAAEWNDKGKQPMDPKAIEV